MFQTNVEDRGFDDPITQSFGDCGRPEQRYSIAAMASEPGFASGSVSPARHGPARHGGVKRAADIVFATVMLLMFAPLIALIALLVWRGNGAPILFAHDRVGQDGRVFKCFKFRTMVKESQRVLDEMLASDPELRRQWISSYKLDNDPRVIPCIGMLLRRTSLDELPQLLNVLRGDMSLVGPRPVTPDELAKYGVYRSHYMSVKPGLTGPWQVSGRSNTSYDERVRMDVWYVENAGLQTDLSILFQTTVSFVTGRLDGAR